jgi:hypothetical protein
MVGPIGLINRAVRPPRPPLALPIARCPVCHDPIYDSSATLTLRGGIHVHRSCATYRTRQRARALLPDTSTRTR